MPIDSETLLQVILELQEQYIDNKEEVLDSILEELEGQQVKPQKKSLNNQPILAIDMDGTLVGTPPHGDGPPPPLDGLPAKEVELPDGTKVSMVEVAQIAHRQGYRIIIFTGRDDLHEIVSWLQANRVPYESINTRQDQPTESPKVIALAYVDDRAIQPQDLANLVMGNQQLGKSIISRLTQRPR